MKLKCLKCGDECDMDNHVLCSVCEDTDSEAYVFDEIEEAQLQAENNFASLNEVEE